jgi:hypothetical protein
VGGRRIRYPIRTVLSPITYLLDGEAQMDLAEYFNQAQYYFSESEGQLVPLDEMAFPRLFSSWMKLRKEGGREFIGSPLDRAFTRRACPTPAVIREQLQTYGKACHAINVMVGPRTMPMVSQVRAKMRNAAKVAGKHVVTHVSGNRSGKWVEATVDTEVAIRVKSH